MHVPRKVSGYVNVNCFYLKKRDILIIIISRVKERQLLLVKYVLQHTFS